MWAAGLGARPLGRVANEKRDLTLLPMRFTDQWAVKTDAAIEALVYKETIEP